MVDPLKQPIIQFIKQYYEQNRKVPSVKNIIERFKEERLNNTRFYKIFPEGMSEACRLAGVPTPTERIKKTAKARDKITKIKEKKNTSAEVPSSHLMLSEEQTNRLLGISHWEGGEDPLLIIDDLLARDSNLRRVYKLSFKDTKRVADALNVAVGRGWKIKSNPDFVDCVTRGHNLGIFSFDPATVKFLLEAFEWARIKKWSPPDFASYVTRHYNEIELYGMYKRGEISFQEFEKRIAKYV